MSRPTHVYLLTLGGVLKIGITAHYAHRMRDIGRELPVYPHEVGALDMGADAAAVEQALKAYLAPARTAGEWYSLTHPRAGRILSLWARPDMRTSLRALLRCYYQAGRGGDPGPLWHRQLGILPPGT